MDLAGKIPVRIFGRYPRVTTEIGRRISAGISEWNSGRIPEQTFGVIPVEITGSVAIPKDFL